MNQRNIKAAIFLLFFLISGFAGLYVGQNYLHFDGWKSEAKSDHWHLISHEKLKITPKQATQLSEIEDRFYEQHKALELQISTANQELAKAITNDKFFSQKVQEATNKIHQSMGELQKLTIQHLFEMRPILTDEQYQKLEQIVTNALKNPE